MECILNKFKRTLIMCLEFKWYWGLFVPFCSHRSSSLERWLTRTGKEEKRKNQIWSLLYLPGNYLKWDFEKDWEGLQIYRELKDWKACRKLNIYEEKYVYTCSHTTVKIILVPGVHSTRSVVEVFSNHSAPKADFISRNLAILFEFYAYPTKISF